MRSSELFWFCLFLFLDFWRPTEGSCKLENGTIALCHYLEDAKFTDTHDLHTLKASVENNIVTPASFRNLTALRYLDLSGGNLVEIYPGSFLQLSQLVSLNLAENHIKHINSSSLEGLKHLQSLNLRKNNIHYLPEALLDLESLKVLDISKNRLNCNCMTVRIRDKLLERGVKFLKNALCSGPSGGKVWSLLKVNSELVCMREEEDDRMQMDQPAGQDVEGSKDLRSVNVESFANDEVNLEKDVDATTGVLGSMETRSSEVLAPLMSTTETRTTKITGEEVPLEETLAPEIPVEDAYPTSKAEEFIISVSPFSKDSLEKNKLKRKDKFFFDNDENSFTENHPVLEMDKLNKNDNQETIRDKSYDIDNEFEGSGTIVPPIDFGWSENETVFDNSDPDEKETDDGMSLFDTMFGSWSDRSSTSLPVSTSTTGKTTTSEIEKEEFMLVTSRIPETEVMLSKSVSSGSIPFNFDTDQANVKNNTLKNYETKQEIADASSQNTKMGNGSMVVLVVLLGFFIALVILAAYKGDFCKKGRAPEDLERGTELKEIRKSLLDDGPQVPPKLSNGNKESVPLIEAPAQAESKQKEVLNQNGNSTGDEAPAAKSNPITSPASESTSPASDLIKTPRKSTLPNEATNSSTNGKANQKPLSNYEKKMTTTPLNLTLNQMKAPPNTPVTKVGFGNPPLSADAQAVKIILQDNPESIPKTPILITRTKMGENLVKTP